MRQSTKKKAAWIIRKERLTKWVTFSSKWNQNLRAAVQYLVYYGWSKSSHWLLWHLSYLLACSYSLLWQKQIVLPAFLDQADRPLDSLAILITLSAFLYFLFFFLHFLFTYWYQITLPLTKIGEHAETSRNMLILEIHAISNRKKVLFLPWSNFACIHRKILSWLVWHLFVILCLNLKIHINPAEVILHVLERD